MEVLLVSSASIWLPDTIYVIILGQQLAFFGILFSYLLNQKKENDHRLVKWCANNPGKIMVATLLLMVATYSYAVYEKSQEPSTAQKELETRDQVVEEILRLRKLRFTDYLSQCRQTMFSSLKWSRDSNTRPDKEALVAEILALNESMTTRCRQFIVAAMDSNGMLTPEYEAYHRAPFEKYQKEVTLLSEWLTENLSKIDSTTDLGLLYERTLEEFSEREAKILEITLTPEII